MSTALIALALGGAVVAIAAIPAMIASHRRSSATGGSRRRTETLPVHEIQQAARDYIVSGVLPRWD
ncbi:MAG: hypothetical protein ACM3JG_05970 [Thiohalocapsa sp.]